jgi:hypothetical protein
LLDSVSLVQNKTIELNRPLVFLRLNFADPCVPNPCVNGNCRIDLELTTGRECICPDLYSGDNCETYNGDTCDIIECFNGGECISTSPVPTCLCTEDYSGTNCETKLTPTIRNCPEGLTATYSLADDSDTAQIDLNITAVDVTGQRLPLTVTGGLTFPGALRFAEEYRAGRVITVEATDAASRRSTCTFTLRLNGE